MWECQTCTLHNKEGARQCVACDADRVSSTVFDGPSDLLAALGETTPWACRSCTYQNAGGYVCGMCYTSKSPVANEEAELGACFETDQFPGAFGEERCAFEQRQGRGKDSEPTGWHASAATPSWQIQGVDEEDYDQRSNVQGRELRIVLIGHTGAGKSATANTILGGDFFKSQASAIGVTTVTKRQHAQRFGRDIHVVDTPGLFDPSMTNDKVVKEITKFIGMTAPGPHAFILVVQIGRFTDEEQKTVAEFKKYFGQQMMNYLIVLFTRVDDLADRTLGDFLVAVPSELKNLLQESSRRYIGFNNKTSTDEKDRQARALLKMIDDMVAKNGVSCYTNEMFEEAEKAMKRQEMALRRELEDKKRKEKEEMERKFQKKMEETKNEYDANVMRMQRLIKELESSQRRGNQMQSSLATKVEELRAQLIQKEREKRQEEERQKMAFHRELEGKIKNEREEIERKFQKKMEETKNEYDANVMQMQQLIKELESSRSHGNQGQSSVATEVVELRAQLTQMEREKRQEEERRIRDNSKRVEDLERRYQRLEDNTRETARKDVEEEGTGFRRVWTGIKNIGKGLLQGFKGLFS